MNEIIHSPVTYGELENKYISQLPENTSRQIIKNYLSDITGWRATFKLSEDSPAGPEFNENFKSSLAAYAERQLKDNKKQSTLNTRVSRIKKIRSFYLELVRDSLILPSRFDHRLAILMRMKNLNASALIKNHIKGEISRCSLNCWLSGKSIPHKDNLPLVVELEKILGVAQNTLLSCLPLTTVYRGRKNSSAGDSKKNPPSDKNRIRFWNNFLGDEFKELVDFKMAPLIPARMLSEKDKKGAKREKKTVWTRSKLGNVPSADFAKAFLSAFYGFLLLPANPGNPLLDGMGADPSELTLALLSNIELVERFVVVFQKARTNGKFHHWHLNFLNFVASLLRPKTGFLYLRHDFAKKIGLNGGIDEWHVRCVDVRDRVLELRDVIKEAKKKGSGEFVMGRNPFHRIRRILELQNPLAATMTIIKLMREEAEKLYSKPARQASLFRDIVLFTLIQAYPFRMITYSFLCFEEHLVKAADGVWWLKLSRDCFKNRRFLTEDYEVPLPFEAGQIIEEYITKYRPLLIGADRCKYVFLKDPARTPIEENYFSLQEEDFMFPPSSLTDVIYLRSEQFIPECEGFRGHSFRHIIAAQILRSDPNGGINLAAKILNDSPATVREYYAHYQTSHYVLPYNQIFSQSWKNAVEGQSGCLPPVEAPLKGAR